MEAAAQLADSMPGLSPRKSACHTLVRVRIANAVASTKYHVYKQVHTHARMCTRSLSRISTFQGPLSFATGYSPPPRQRPRASCAA